MIACKQCELLIVKFRTHIRNHISISQNREISEKGPSTSMANIFRILSEEDKLTDELFAFVTDSNADRRNERAIISVLHELIPEMVSVAECMILDGVEERHYVADYVHAVVGGEGRE